MNTSGSMFGRLGRVGIVFAGVVALWWMITHYGKALDIDTRGEQVLAFVLVCLVLVLIRYAPALSRYVKEIYYRRQAQKINALPDEEGRITLTPPRHITVEEIRQELCHLYGRCWPRKLRILLITGSASDVEQLIPKLTQKFWQEDQGTLLLWGGDPAAPADTAWLTALRKLRRRPVDGVVWVTSAFDRLAGSDTELAAPLPGIYCRMRGCPAMRNRPRRSGARRCCVPLMRTRTKTTLSPFTLDAFSASGKTFSEGRTMKMAITAGKALAITLATLLTGCGLTQKVTDGTVAVTKSIFYREVKTLHLDIQAREGVNNNAKGASLATVVRIYQLKERKAFDSTDYPSLFASDSQAIKADLVAEKDIRLRPGESVTLDMPMEESAQVVAVAGMFMAPDQVNDTWRITLTRDDLDPDKARVIEVSNNRLTLKPLEGE